MIVQCNIQINNNNTFNKIQEEYQQCKGYL